MAFSGFQADVKVLQKQLAARHLVNLSASAQQVGVCKVVAVILIEKHQLKNGREPTLLVAAGLGFTNELPCNGSTASNTLYYRRFFPYYSFNVLGGLDDEGKGCVFTYDAVGSYERVGYGTQGTGSTLIMPFLDNQLKSPSPLLLPAQDAVTQLSESEAVDLVRTVYASATERDIYTVSFFFLLISNFGLGAYCSHPNNFGLRFLEGSHALNCHPQC
ncbi:N-terminal nucleophile aminohydrolases (Ntn hydrolases) superfamily protein, putative [Theobroma cacao]|uniref:N-terminal nucleophile aminohydrolases (Ntn hydrolases) superfamily protein, putative n=1 Tax=Theobroma cacao TaxID=3641 RepID=A0A061EZ08_THECC|nr:N-terminal nucleophile aminohydrolases (Ntn hydrolases) superfamily protein, putative [Theobroma cacao]